MAYRALQDKLPHFKKGDVVEINIKYAKDLIDNKIIEPMGFVETKEFFDEQGEGSEK